MEVNNGEYLPCHSVAQFKYPPLFTNTEVNIFFQKPKRVVYFGQYYNEKGLKVDFVFLPAWQWIVLADFFSTNESAHMKCTLHLCGIFRQVIFVNVRFFVNFVTSVYQFYFFHVISLWFIGDEQRSQREKWEESCACFINHVRAGCCCFFLFLLRKLFD